MNTSAAPTSDAAPRVVDAAAPVDAAPVDAAPVDAAPVDAAPVDAAPGVEKTVGPVTATLEGQPQRLVARIAHGATAKIVVDEPAPAERWYQVKVAVSEVVGGRGRVYLVQRFGEEGEDEFSRDIAAWVVDAARDEVLWSGTGVFSNSFDECTTFAVPEPSIERGTLVVRVMRGTKIFVRGTTRCKRERVTHKVVARIPLR